MRYPAPEKLEIVRLVGQSHLTVRATLEKLGITRSTYLTLVRRLQPRRPRSSGRPPLAAQPGVELSAD